MKCTLGRASVLALDFPHYLQFVGLLFFVKIFKQFYTFSPSLISSTLFPINLISITDHFSWVTYWCLVSFRLLIPDPPASRQLPSRYLEFATELLNFHPSIFYLCPLIYLQCAVLPREWCSPREKSVWRHVLL